MATVADHIKDAETIVNEAGLKDDALRPIAFREVLRRKLADSAADGGRVPFQRSLVPVESNSASDKDDSTSIVAKALDVSPDTINAVLTISDDSVCIEVPTSCLSAAKSDAAKQVAIVVTAVNKALGRETQSPEVHSILKDYGKLDNHFMEHIRTIPKDILSTKGRPRSKHVELILRKGGMEEAKRIVEGWADG